MYAYNTLYHGTSGIYVPHSPYITIRTVTSKILKNKTKICLSICTHVHSLGHVAFYVWQCKLWFKFIKISHRQTDRQTTDKKRKKVGDSYRPKKNETI